MLKNNNKNSVKLIAKRSMKSNRVRNTFAVIAVILTTLMLTSVFTIMLSLGKNMNIMQLRLQGTCSSIFLNNPSAEQLDAAKKIQSINAVGTYIDIGTVTLKEKEENPISVSMCDSTEFEKNITPAVCNINGKYPSEENEVMLSAKALEVLGISSPQLGMNISLKITGQDGTVSEKTFTLSGTYKDFSSVSGNAAALVSEKYATSNGFTVEKDGVMSVSCKPNKQNDAAAELERLTLRNGQTLKCSFDTQSENGSVMLMITVMIVLISAIIVLSGYLLIYNVMYISVTKDIRFYGMLKTIGTSPSQIRRIVKAQAFRFLIIGLPVGVFLGTFISFAAAPLATSMFSSGAGRMDGIMPTSITFNPLIYIGTLAFATLTVVLSCRKPAKIASSVSPVEALKYNGIKGGRNFKERNSKNGGKPSKMAFRNVFREKKRAALVFASLFMGTMAFLSVNTFIGCLKIDNYMNTYLPNDYSVYSLNFEDASKDDKNNAMYSLAESMKKIESMDFVELNRSFAADLEFDLDTYQPFIDYASRIFGKDNCDAMAEDCKVGKYPFRTQVIGVSSRMLKRYNKTAHSKIDIDAFEKGEAALLGEVGVDGEGDGILGRKIKLTNPENGKSTDIEIGSVSSYMNNTGLNIGNRTFSGISPSYILVSDKVIDELSDNPSIEAIIADYGDSSSIAAADAVVMSLINNNRYVEAYDIKNQELSEFKSSISSLNVLTSGISIVLIMIGILNFINVMLTGVYTRRRELAVLESVGMTGKQIRSMLMFEGLYYALITISLILTLGNAIMYLVVTIAKNIADYAVFYYPIALMSAIAVFILAVCIIVPSSVYRAASKESVTQRLRDVQ